MKKFLVVIATFSVLGCSKNVTRAGSSFAQTEGPNPTSTSPAPTPTPPSQAACAPDRLGKLTDFALYVKEDLKLDHVKIGKSIAATDADIQSAEVGGSVGVAQTLILKSVKVPNGKVTYGKSIEKVRSSALEGFEKAPLMMDADLFRIAEFSKACGETASNTIIKRVCMPGMSPQICTLRIIGKSPYLNVAELTPSEIANVSTFIIDVPKGSTLVTNLAKTQLAFFRSVAVKFSPRAEASPSLTRLYWNFPVADSLEFDHTKFHGTVIAPGARVRIGDQCGEAGFWVRELNGLNSTW